MLTLLPAGSTACGRGSQALGAARARRGVLPLLPGPWGSGLVSLPRCGPLGTAFLSPSCGARLAGFWLSTAPFLCCGHSGPTLGAEPGLLGRGPRGQRSFPLWLSSDFWLQFLASGNLLFRTSLRALRPVCLRPTWGLLCRPGRRRATTSSTRCSAVWLPVLVRTAGSDRLPASWRASFRTQDGVPLPGFSSNARCRWPVTQQPRL